MPTDVYQPPGTSYTNLGNTWPGDPDNYVGSGENPNQVIVEDREFATINDPYAPAPGGVIDDISSGTGGDTVNPGGASPGTVTSVDDGTAASLPLSLDVVLREGFRVSGGEQYQQTVTPDSVDEGTTGTKWVELPGLMAGTSSASVVLGADASAAELTFSGFRPPLPLGARITAIQVDVDRTIASGSLASEGVTMRQCVEVGEILFQRTFTAPDGTCVGPDDGYGDPVDTYSEWGWTNFVWYSASHSTTSFPGCGDYGILSNQLTFETNKLGELHPTVARMAHIDTSGQLHNTTGTAYGYEITADIKMPSTTDTTGRGLMFLTGSNPYTGGAWFVEATSNLFRIARIVGTTITTYASVALVGFDPSVQHSVKVRVTPISPPATTSTTPTKKEAWLNGGNYISTTTNVASGGDDFTGVGLLAAWTSNAGSQGIWMDNLIVREVLPF